jgi:signal transduction histidine kinase
VSSSAEVAASALARSPSDRRLRILAWAIFSLCMAGGAVSLYLDGLTGRLDNDLWLLPFFAYPIVGVILATRLPRNPLGWLMLAAGLGFMNPFESWGHYLIDPAGNEHLAAVAVGLSQPTWVLFIGLSGFMLLLFPDGRLPSPRWRWFAWTCGVGLVLLAAFIFVAPGTFEDAPSDFVALRNPFGIEALEPIVGPLLVLVASAPAIVLGGAAGLIARLRRTRDPVQRHQLRWVAWSAGVIAATYLLAFVPSLIGPSSNWDDLISTIAVMTFMLIPITIGIGVMKYRLYDIDIVIRKTVIYAILAALLVLLGVAIAWIIGGLFASAFEGGRADLVSGVAIGVAFWPLRALATRIADRVVYRGRATPYQVLSEFGDRLAGTYAAEDVLPRTARVLGEGVGADRATVWLWVGGALEPVATWRRDDFAVDGPDDERMEVRHQGELLGALSVRMPANDPLDPTRAKLVSDLSAQAGLLLRNVRLVEDLRASRRRLVAAQDQERRRLERNIHDGAQQQLVALAVKARLARQLTERDPTKAAQMLGQIEEETQTALEDLRDLARGIYPPLLADRGLAAAVEAQARKVPVPVKVRSDGVGRLDPQVEAAAYFSILECLQNVAKYSDATDVSVDLAIDAGALAFSVTDDGRGFDPDATGFGTGLQGIADRLGSLDGSVTVVSSFGGGTVVSGRVPVQGASGTSLDGRSSGDGATVPVAGAVG